MSLADPPRFSSDGNPPPMQSEPELAGVAYLWFRLSDPDSSAERAILSLSPNGILREDIRYAQVARWIDENSEGVPREPSPEISDEQSSSALAGFRRSFPLILGAAIGSVIFPGVGTAIGAAIGAGAVVVEGAIGTTLHSNSVKAKKYEVRRLRHLQRWVRDDPITRLAPGSTSTIELKLGIGVTKTRASELSGTIGLSSGVSFGQLSANLSKKFQSSIALARHEEVARKLELKNDLPGSSRRFAVWHVVNSIHVESLACYGPEHLTWRSVAAIEYVDPTFSLHTTSPGTE